MDKGRPRVQINWADFDKLCSMHCTLIEIADWFGCSEDTIERACKREKGEIFAEYYKKRTARGSVSLRRAQMQKALGTEPKPIIDVDGRVLLDKKGNPVFTKGVTPSDTMLIWLGKQYLGQHEKFTEE